MELTFEQKSRYQKLIKYQSAPISTRTPRSLEVFGELIGMSKEEYQMFKEQEDYPHDLYRQSKRWHMINRTEVLNSFYEQLKTSGRIKPTELSAYMKVLETDEDEKGATYNQFNFLGDISDEQKKRLANALKKREGTKRFADTNS